MKKKPSFIFAPYKSLGVHTTAVKPVFFTNSNRKRPYVSLYCPLDNTLAEYNANRLRLITVSDCLPADITAVAVKTLETTSHGIYVAAGKAIYCMTFCRQVERVINLKCEVKHMIIMGEQLVLIDIENGLWVIDIESGVETIHLEGVSSFEVTSIIHPATYMNKVILGSSKGSLKIVNIRTGKVIHQFIKIAEGAITVLEQTPALDVLAIGASDGSIILHNIKLDEKLMEFHHDKSISAIGFRTDDSPMMTSADAGGNIAVWDLEKQELVGKISGVHKAAVTQLYFFRGEPTMVSTSADNSIRVWILNSGDSMPRQLNILEGHAEPASAVSFASNVEIITASLDGSVRKHSVIHNSMRAKLGDAGVMSKAKAKKKKRDVSTIKIDPIVDISMGFTREAAWDNILCRHADSLPVSTWTSRKSTMGKHQLIHPRFTTDSSLFGTTATATCVSPCGNFAFIGYSTGHVDQFNIQSGRLIKSFGEETTVEKGLEVSVGKAHTAAVTMLSIDIRGSELVSGSKSGELKFWETRKGKCTTTMRTKLNIYGCTKSPASSLIAVSCADKHGPSIAIIDTLCRRVVRTFKEVGKQLNAVSFSSDGKWLLTADNECYIRVWELATSKLIDVMLFSKPCIGISFNETGTHVATIHEGEKSIEVWVNKKLFTARLNIKALPVDYIPTWEDSNEEIELTLEELDKLKDEEEMDTEDNFDEGLVVYSGLPPSRWANLSELTLIRERNKPTEPVRKPKQAPFFLTAAATLEGFEFDIPQDDEEEQRKTIQAKRSLLELESSLTASLRRAKIESDYMFAFYELKKMSLSAIDVQLRNLPVDVLPQFFKMLLEVLKTKRDFDLVQSYMAACIKIHRLSMCNGETDDELCPILESLSLEMDNSWKPFDDILTENAAVVQWIKNALL